ncbi:MAG: Txe/YoeB family addiction module toxin [Caldilineaceae bacterium]|nr:Txe/YoeB family addiction module toxin [Caldilineaceae bacterium]
MRRIAFLPEAFADFTDWATTDRKTHAKIVSLVRDIQRDPFAGLGKPEPLKHELAGLWSRRITEEHRLVYRVTDDDIVIISCRYHYSK